MISLAIALVAAFVPTPMSDIDHRDVLCVAVLQAAELESARNSGPASKEALTFQAMGQWFSGRVSARHEDWNVGSLATRQFLMHAPAEINIQSLRNCSNIFQERMRRDMKVRPTVK